MSDRPIAARIDAAVAELADPQPIAWRPLLIIAGVQVLLHLLTNGRYGIFRDEYYYLACAARPAWGYVDQPPLSIWILAAWKAVFGDSVHALRILPALCGAGLIFLTGATAAELGGRRWAQSLAGLAVAMGAAGLVICGFYSMNAFDMLVWIGAYWLLIRILRSGDGRWWPWLGLLLGIGLLNKIGLLVFGVALAIALVATPHRRHLVDRRLWLAGGIALIFLLPYLIWNATHDWATWEFIQNAKQYKISGLSPLVFLKECLLEANPLTVPLWLGGLLWLLLARRARRFRLVGMMFVLTYLILILQKSKPYYLAASFSVLIAAGGVAWENWTDGRRWRWLRWFLAANLLAGFIIFAPMALPLLPLERSVAYMQRLGIVPTPQEVGHDAAAPQYFADRFGWENLAASVAAVCADLPAGERSHCVIVASNYGQAGALEYWAEKYDLPPVYCFHNNYWFWGPPPATGVVIAVTYHRKVLDETFAEVSAAGAAETPRALESRIPIWLCRDLQRPMDELWNDLKNFI